MTKIAAFTLLTLFATFPGIHDGPAPDAHASPIVGHWELQVDSSSDPSEAVEEATHDMGRLARRRAQGRLVDLVTPADSLFIEMVDDTVVVTAWPGTTLRVVPDGEPTELRNERGDVARLSAVQDDDALIVTLHAGTAERTQRFTPSADGLRVEATYTHDALTEPIHLAFSYRRMR